MLIFNPKTFGTHLIAQLPEKACLHQCAIVGPCLFVAGGFDSFSCIMDSVHRLDLTNGKWTKMPKMKNKRACFQLVALGDFLFAIGGLTPGGYTKTLERFDMISEEWELAAPLQESRYRHAACVTNKGKVKLKILLKIHPTHFQIYFIVRTNVRLEYRPTISIPQTFKLSS